MTSSPSPTREPAWGDVLVWFETIDAIVRGLGHSLNNRALALSATIESLDAKRPVGAEISASLIGESARLTEHLRQLRALPFAAAGEPMPLLLPDVLSVALHLHRSHASLGDVSAYLEGTAETPPVLASESSLVHAALVTLTAMKGFAAPGGVVRVSYAGTPEQATVTFRAERDPSDERNGSGDQGLITPTSLAAALLGGARVEIEQRIGVEVTSVMWLMPSLRTMRRLAREMAAAG